MPRCAESRGVHFLEPAAQIYHAVFLSSQGFLMEQISQNEIVHFKRAVLFAAVY